MKYLLFVLACAAGQPQHCLETSVVLAEVTNPAGCHLAGHFRLSQYVRAHPTLKIEEAHCVRTPIEMSQADTTARQ